VVHNSSKQDCGKALPSLFGGIDCSYRALNTFQQLWPQSFGLTIAQPIYRGGRTTAQSAEALNQVRAERAHLVSVEEAVFLNVVTDYMAVALAQAQLDVTESYEQGLAGEIDSVKKRLAAGEVTLTDVSEAEAFHAQALAGKRSLVIQLEAARAAYQHDVGVLPGRLDLSIAVPDAPKAVEDAVAAAAVANPDVVSALYTETAAENNVDLVFGQRLPTLSLNATVQRAKEVTASGLRTDTGEAYAQLSFPLYEGGAISSQVRQAEEVVALRKHQVDDSRRAAVRSARQAFEEVTGAASLIEALEGQVKAYDKALDGVRHEATVGDRSVFDILYQEQGLYQSHLTLAQARHDEIVARFTLAQAIGGLTARTLGLAVDYYDPDEHFEDVEGRDGLP
jgi:outer membrane protein